ncbi:hypothetical protein DACRYDRAFT_107985 [Dacryopinax primogenitus]|uniref:Uncharacterized protein n=1 Tax=Dacryopinax primogenitus (strain DJM 731) TaxID=1858805 RepID=M5FY20_DACPD|nr:uncharacterized protein DACRYDRAFT_107985 [Dacryopinax primogenitus]EJU01434.1 hypothetical protein DACRYDRAFT_107985 [Dacryopinax primogenitus]
MSYPTTYPPPLGHLPPFYIPFPIRPLPPPTLHPPPSLPSLPSPPRPSPFPGWELTTHLIPSASPRASPTATTRNIRPQYPPTLEREKEDRAREVERLRVAMRAQRARDCERKSWVSYEGEPRLWNVLNRFMRSPARLSGGAGADAEDGLTILLTHANGFPKEVYEPFLSFLLSSYTGIREIWVWEAVNHGDAALVNAAKLGDTCESVWLWLCGV